MTDKPIITLENVKKVYDDETVLHDINFELEKGKFYTLLGPSGCGKTTILRLIAGFADATEGVIKINGETVNDIPANRRKVNTVFQDYALFPHMNVFDNIAFGLTIKKMPKDQIIQKVKEALKMVQLEGYENREISEMSGGQQQRVALARAVATDPELLLLDEVTSALDPLLVGEVLDFVAELKAEGRTIIMATHEMDFARSSADRIVFLADGQIVESGTPEQIFTAPRQQRTAQFLARHR